MDAIRKGASISEKELKEKVHLKALGLDPVTSTL